MHLKQEIRETDEDYVKEKCSLFECQSIKHKVTNWGHCFYISNWRWEWDHYFTWSSEPPKGPASCSAKGVPSFLNYVKTLSIGLAPGNQTCNLLLCSLALYQLS